MWGRGWYARLPASGAGGTLEASRHPCTLPTGAWMVSPHVATRREKPQCLPVRTPHAGSGGGWRGSSQDSLSLPRSAPTQEAESGLQLAQACLEIQKQFSGLQMPKNPGSQCWEYTKQEPSSYVISRWTLAFPLKHPPSPNGQRSTQTLLGQVMSPPHSL